MKWSISATNIKYQITIYKNENINPSPTGGQMLKGLRTVWGISRGNAFGHCAQGILIPSYENSELDDLNIYTNIHYHSKTENRYSCLD